MLALVALTIALTPSATVASRADAEAASILSEDYRRCFGPDAALSAESFPCLDREYRRLDALLTREYRAALARQGDAGRRDRLVANEHRWWRTRFTHCRAEVEDLRGSTAAVIRQSCEIDALAARIVALRRVGGR